MTQPFDMAPIRAEFPVTKRMLYLDSAHQTPLATSVRAALQDFLAEGNETAGPKPVWLRRVEQTRAKVAALFSADASEIAFTKNLRRSEHRRQRRATEGRGQRAAHRR